MLKLIILKLLGGLGNQMFIYAFYRSLLYSGIDCKIDVSWFEHFKMHNGYELNRIFNLNLNIAGKKEIRKYADINVGLMYRIKSRILVRHTQLVFGGHKAITYYEEVYGMDNVYLDGFWQSQKYFKVIEDEIRRNFIFPDKEIKKNSALNDLETNIKHNINSISLHVRRGDYLDKEIVGIKSVLRRILLGRSQSPKLGEVCNSGYYTKAIEYVESKITKPFYYVFSDDIDWCKSNLCLPKGRHSFVDINKNENSYLDMYLMSQCNHNIIANSSFSWWGAWLNSNDDKIVIAPDRWFQDGYSGDIVPDNWVKVSTT